MVVDQPASELFDNLFSNGKFFHGLAMKTEQGVKNFMVTPWQQGPIRRNVLATNYAAYFKV